VLTGDRIDAARAFQVGLIARMVGDGDAVATAVELASQLARRAPEALRTAKASLRHAMNLPLDSHLLSERHAFVGLLSGGEKAEGIAAFREKRPPSWTKI
jgi:enoyl-CoA hydratase